MALKQRESPHIAICFFMSRREAGPPDSFPVQRASVESKLGFPGGFSAGAKERFMPNISKTSLFIFQKETHEHSIAVRCEDAIDPLRGGVLARKPALTLRSGLLFRWCP